MTIKELESLAKYIFNALYEEELDIPVRINNRLRTTLGWFKYDLDDTKKKKPINLQIELSKTIASQDIYLIADTLAHELTHYYLFKHDKPFDDDDIEFKSLLFQYGIGPTETTFNIDGKVLQETYFYKVKCKKCNISIDYSQPTVGTKMIEYLPTIKCPKCGKNLMFEFEEIAFTDYKPSMTIQFIVDDWKEERLKQN